MSDDPRIGQYERERDAAVTLAHQAMLTSYIGAPPPGLRGDADRMVAALIKVGWTPPGEQTVEHALELPSGGMQVRADGLERVYPLDQWIVDKQHQGARVHRRRIIVVDDWTEVRRG